MTRPAFFLDRDGVLNRLVWREGKPVSPRLQAEFELVPGVAELGQALRTAGYVVVVATNQPDLTRGHLSADDLSAMHALLSQELQPDRIEVAEAGHDSDRRRKPNPGMLEDASAALQLDLARSWMLGDTDKDLEAARRAGVRPLLLEHPHNLHLRAGAHASFADLAAVCQWVRACSV